MNAGDRVAVRLRYYGRGKGSGAELERRCTTRSRRSAMECWVRMEHFTAWAEALEAAGG